MTGQQWQKLVAVTNGQLLQPLPVGFIIDSPWLPGWAGVKTIDYFSSDEVWLEANLKAVRQFRDCIFLPGFWAEFGMCTEPSAFGCKCSWAQNEPPHAEKILTDIKDVASLARPNTRADGLLPLVLSRLQFSRKHMEAEGHLIKFAVSRGPLNIASFLLGTTEFLTAIRTNPDQVHEMLDVVTDFTIDWLGLQAQAFGTIDGIFILDDIVGFLGPEDFEHTALPYLHRIFQSLDVTIKFFHNDARGLVCAPHLGEIGVNLFNFSFEHSLAEMKELTNNAVTLLGNIPPREVLADGTPEDVRNSVRAALDSVADRTRIILSCGGGMPPNVTTENIKAVINAAKA